MKKTIFFTIFITLLVFSAYSSINDNSRMIMIFKEFAEFQEKTSDPANMDEYLNASAKLDREIENEISKLTGNTQKMNELLDYLDKNEDIKNLVFLPVLKKIQEELSSIIIMDPSLAGHKFMLDRVNNIVNRLRKYGKLTFVKKDNSKNDEKYIKLVKSIYSSNINPGSIDKDFELNKGFATNIMQNIAWERKKGNISEQGINAIKKITELAFFKGTVNEVEAQNIDTVEVYTLKTDNFVIKYQKTGENKVKDPEKDDNSNGVPDYVDSVGEFLEKSLKYQTEDIGFMKPALAPSFEVVILNMRDYGVTIPDFEDDNLEKCFIQIDNDYSGDNYNSKGLDGAKVTCAHELFHSVQAKYGLFRNPIFERSRWMAEGTAVLMEEKIFPDVNDYITYVNNSRNVYFKDTKNPIFMLYASQSYHAIVWFKFLEEQKIFDSQIKVGEFNGNNILLSLWENVGKREYSSIEAHLELFGDKFFEVFRNFNLFRYDYSKIEDSDLWNNNVNYEYSTSSYPVNKNIEEYQCAQVFGANYYRFESDKEKVKDIKIAFKSDYPYPVTAIIKLEDGKDKVIDVKPDKKEWELPLKSFGEKLKQAVLIIYNVDRNNRGIPYSLEVK